jgi:DNA-binding response OmpR family regulator
LTSTKILLIDDSEIDQKVILGILGKQHTVVVAGTLEKARQEIERGHFDLLLLDVDLPDGNGFRFFAQLRGEEKTKSLPVIFLTMKSEAPDEIMGFSLGAEDYISKPVDPAKVRARIEARLKKLVDRRQSDALLLKEDLKLDLTTQRAFVTTTAGSTPIDLTPQEFKVLSYFMRHEDHVLSRNQLIDAVWNNQVNVVDRTVDMHVSNIRKKISASAYTIKSVHGVGYRFTKSAGTPRPKK